MRASRASLLAALGALLVVAGLLRFAHLDQGLRHQPHMDERYFVENVDWMLSKGSLDHRFYEYPGLFFYLLAPALALVHGPAVAEAARYEVARGVVGAFGVVNVLLLFLLGERTAGRVAGLSAAAFLAVSPVDVQTSHMVRPDVVLATFVLLALLAFEGVGEGAAGDARAGLALGAAAAVKFTGLLLVPCYLLRRLLAPGRRARGVLLAGALGAFAFALLSPYAVLHAREFYEGARTQVTYHYEEKPAGADAGFGMLLAYAGVWPKALGVPGALLALAGLVLVGRRWRGWAPLLLLPLLTLAVFATQEYRFERHLVPSFGVVALLAGVALGAVAERRPAAAAALAACLALPLSSSLRYLRTISEPGTRDVAVDWIEGHVPAGSLILNAVEGLGIDRGRFEVVEVQSFTEANRILIGEADALVTATPSEERFVEAFPVAFVAEPRLGIKEPRIRVRFVPPGARPEYRDVPLARALLSASREQQRLDALRDGRPDTRWEVPGDGRRDWVEVFLPEPARLSRVELDLGDDPGQFGRGLRLAVSADGARWEHLHALKGRPRADSQLGARAQVFVFEPVEARGLRVARRAARAGRPWGIAELRLEAVAERETVVAR